MEECVRCKEVDYDRRTLWMSCYYQMNELEIPLEQTTVDERVFYTMRVCKKCRSEWLMSIRDWFSCPTPVVECGSGIYVRRFGYTAEVTAEEFARDYL